MLINYDETLDDLLQLSIIDMSWELFVVQQLIMQKAAEELKKQQEKEALEKKTAVEARVPKLQIDGLDKCELLMALAYFRYIIWSV